MVANQATTLLLASLFLPSSAAQDVDRLDVQANQFTRGSQQAVSLSGDEDRSVLVWQSRGQQEGSYGIYARAFAPDGSPLTDEVVVNAARKSHQQQPAACLDDDGGVWFVWRSHEQDLSQGSIVARRFSADLSTATAEVIVNDVPDGHQTDPAIVALPGGEALVLWLDPRGAEPLAVRARQLSAKGEPVGEAFDVSSGDTDHAGPTAALLNCGAVAIAYGRLDEAGRPDGVFLRLYDEGELGEELRLDVDGSAQAIEPALAATESGLLAGWLATNGEGYGLRVRAHNGEAFGPVREFEAEGSTWLNGLSLTTQGDRAVMAWNEYVDGPKRKAGLFTRDLDPMTAKAKGEPFRVTSHTDGTQAIAVATPGEKVVLRADGSLAIGWSGDAGHGDDSAACMTLVVPEGVALAESAPETTISFENPEVGAANPTHDPPTFDPRDVVRDRTDTTVGPAGASTSFLAFTSTGWTPPDPDLAVGPNHIVAVVNGGIAFFQKNGNQTFFADINGGGGFWGSVGASGFVYDPEAVFDVHSQRFFVFASDFNNGFLVSVSDDDNPNGSWNHYLIPTIGMFGTNNVDSGNLAVDDTTVSITGDIFSPSRYVLLHIDKASMIAGGALTMTDHIITNRHSMGSCVNTNTGTQPLYCMWAHEFTSSTEVVLYAIENRATSPTVTNVALTVPAYEHPNDPPQMGTSVRPELFEARFWSATVVGDRLWAVHHEGDPRARVQWYEFDLNGWPNGPAPTLLQTGEINLGAGIHTFFPSIWADAAGNAAITFARGHSNEFISMQMAHRTASMPAGTMTTPIEIQASTGADNSGRWGDYSGTESDPVSPGTFWGHHEYNQGSWRTRIASIDICNGGASNYCTSSTNSSGGPAVMGASGSFSVADNSLTLECTSCPSSQFGLFFFGNSSNNNPLGDGTLCIGGSIWRLPVISTTAGGTASYAVNNTSLPGGQTFSPGLARNFQFWFRDPGFGAHGFNLSDGLTVTFCP